MTICRSSGVFLLELRDRAQLACVDRQIWIRQVATSPLERKTPRSAVSPRSRRRRSRPREHVIVQQELESGVARQTSHRDIDQ